MFRYGANFCYMMKINSRGPDNDEGPINDVWSYIVQKENERVNVVYL